MLPDAAQDTVRQELSKANPAGVGHLRGPTGLAAPPRTVLRVGWPTAGHPGEQPEMDDVEVGRRVTSLVAVLARMNDKVSKRDLDALQECLRLAESVPGLCEGLVQVRLAKAEAGPRSWCRLEGRPHRALPRPRPAHTGTRQPDKPLRVGHKPFTTQAFLGEPGVGCRARQHRTVPDTVPGPSAGCRACRVGVG